MTTYTYSGLYQKWSDALDDWGSIGPTTLKIVTADLDHSFSYSKLPPQPGDDDEFPSIAFSEANPYNVWLDDVQIPFGGDVLIGQIAWGAANVTYLMIFVDEDENDHLFQLGGDLLPTFDTLADFKAFEATITSTDEILSGAFAPGSLIEFGGLLNGAISENDTINGDASANKFHGGLGRDKIYGEAGRDKLFGDSGNDKLWGGGHADKLVGGGGKDKLFGGKGADTLLGGAGSDTLNGGGAGDKLVGGTGHDLLLGKDGKDTLSAGGGDDVLYGGKGADTLQGGKGNDDLRGGAGADVFLYSGTTDEGGDVIFDFKSGVDVIHIAGDISAADVALSGDEDSAVMMWDDTIVTLLGVDVATFGFDDIIFT